MIKWSELTKEQRDALVTEKVMGLRVQWLDVVPSLPPVAVIVDENEIVKGNPEHYSTDMNAAWQIAELEKFSMVQLKKAWLLPGESPCYDCIISVNGPMSHAKAKTAQEAICLASLKAIGEGIEP